MEETSSNGRQPRKAEEQIVEVVSANSLTLVHESLLRLRDAQLVLFLGCDMQGWECLKTGLFQPKLQGFLMSC